MIETKEITKNKQESSPTDEWLSQADVKWFGDNADLKAPKDTISNLQFRYWIKKLSDPKIDLDHSIKHKILKQAEKDIIFFFNTFLWTQDPRKRPADLPFITYDYEDNYIKWIVKHIVEGNDCFTEKSRDMGMSWTLMGVILHGWLFKPGFLAHIGSKKEDDVDRSGDMRSLFEKLRYLLRSLPTWLQPYQFNWNKHSMFMRLLNPMNDNSITGESANRNFGKAGRSTVIVLDEFAAMEYATEAWTSTADVSPCRIVNSTPLGTGNKFWELRFKSNIDKFTAHWTMHPEKSKGAYLVSTKEPLDSVNAFLKWKKGEEVGSPWYDGEVQRRLTSDSQSKIDIAQELDIDYLVSGNPYFDTKALKKQEEWELTEDWVHFRDKQAIFGVLTEIDGQIEFRPNPNGWLRLFEKPRKAGQYVGGLDPAAGSKGGDFSAGAWREKRTRNLVAGIYGHYDYDELSYYAFLVSKYFNSCLVCAESGGYGAAVNKRLYDLGANVARTVDLTTGVAVENDKLGFVTSTKTRPQLLGDMEAEIRENACELRDKDLLAECLNFIVKGGKPQASEGSHDDYIFAWGIAGQLMRINPYSQDIEKNYKKTNVLQKTPARNQGIKFKGATA